MSALLTVLLLGLQSSSPAPHVVFIVGENEYGSYETVPALAKELEKSLGIKATMLLSDRKRRTLPDLDALDNADLIFLALRFRKATDEQIARLKRWFDDGKPAIALRTTSHAFEGRPDWFPPFFGGHYKAHAPNNRGTSAMVVPWMASHPVVQGVDRFRSYGKGGTYNTQPLAETAKVLMLGRTEKRPTEPVTWVNRYRPESRILYTSLGSRQHFKRPAFKKLLANGVRWCLDREVSEEVSENTAPAPPARTPPPNATVLFDGKSAAGFRHWDPSVPPMAIGIDQRADTSGAGPDYQDARWAVEDGALVGRPGFGDVVSALRMGHHHLHLDFWIPPTPDWVPNGFRGRGGVYLGGRVEIELAEDRDGQPGETSSGAIFGTRKPDQKASRPAGTWQSLDVAYRHDSGEPARATVWLNGVRIHDDVSLPERTVQGFQDADAEGNTGPGRERGRRQWSLAESRDRFDIGGGAFTWVARFRTQDGGTLLSKSPPRGEWKPNAKALFIRGGRLVYDIGWVGAITSRTNVADGGWHHAALTYRDGAALLYVDGKLEARRDGFTAPDEASHVLKAGAASTDFAGRFDGDIAYAAHIGESLDDPGIAAIAARDTLPEGAAVYRDGGDALPRPAALLRGVPGPLRLQADTAPIRFANIWVRPLADVDHRAMIEGFGDVAFARGENVYKNRCYECHGEGFKKDNPAARNFMQDPLKFGSDPDAMWRTMTYGSENMPPQTLLSPQERYDAIHYVRERFFKGKNPSQYFKVTQDYLDQLPVGIPPRESADPVGAAVAPKRDYGPALASQLKSGVSSVFTVRAGDHVSLSYDLHRMSISGAWFDGFLDLSDTQHHRLRGEGQPTPAGRPLHGLETWEWAHGADDRFGDPAGHPPRAPLPETLVRHRGHYYHGRKTVISYDIDGRGVLELPESMRVGDHVIVSQTLHIAPGSNDLVLCVARREKDPKGMQAVLPFDLKHQQGVWEQDGDVAGHLVLAAGAGGSLGVGPFVAAGVAGDVADLEWEIDEDRLLLRMPASRLSRVVRVLRRAGKGTPDLAAFAKTVALAQREQVVDPITYTKGGPKRWGDPIVTRGEVGSESANGYALDRIGLPEPNPFNAWMKMSALDFFPDGTAAVSTYGGDLWLVSGLDADLQNVTWQRFATGMFEPLGVKVIDGKVLVMARDRILRLHDLNDDGEADWYETFLADDDVSRGFHAFNFDLNTDSAGNLYYVKPGQYTDYKLGGAVIKVAPDGSRSERVCTGFRVPNGMSIGPDDAIYVTDNQGNWMPAGKISKIRPGGFYGYGGHLPKRPKTFDHPMIWFPQEFDNSCGSQVFAMDPRFGPLAGKMIHTSYGRGWIYWVCEHEVDGVAQAAASRFPFQCASGVMRIRQGPHDGAVYATGLKGWDTFVKKDGCFDRIRPTGEPSCHMVGWKVERDAIVIEYSQPLDDKTASDPSRWKLSQWNYRWTPGYGSPKLSPKTGKNGTDPLPVTTATLSNGGRTVRLAIEGLKPVHQVWIQPDVKRRDGAAHRDQIYLTINKVPR